MRVKAAMSESADLALRRANELLRAGEERYRLIADNVGDVIWLAPMTLSDAELDAAKAKVNLPAVIDAVLDRWRFSYASPAVERVLGYTPEEAVGLPLRAITTPASLSLIREAMIRQFLLRPPAARDSDQQHVLETEFCAKDGSSRWCEVVSTYLRDQRGIPTSVLGITRDISQRRKAEQSLRASESKLRSLVENLPDFIITVDRDAKIQFANRAAPEGDRKDLAGQCGFGYIIPEHREIGRLALDRALAAGVPQTIEVQDIFGHWWACRVVSLAAAGEGENAMIICTDVTQERLAAEAVRKEQQLLRQLLDLHERERQLTAYELHDGFAQQLTGAMYRLQGFREAHARDPAEAWKHFDAAMQLIGRAVDETRRLISGLRPPILDESGIVRAIEYLVCEYRQQNGTNIEFHCNVAFDRLAPPLETAIFRIVQESLQNACRHSRSGRIRVGLAQRGDRVCLDVLDWGVGFAPEAVEQRCFGLRGIRERVRLLDGRVVIDSAPGKGTHIAVELPLVDSAGGSAAL